LKATLISHQSSYQDVYPVNREEQLTEFSTALDRMNILGKLQQTLWEWYGSPGIGKTILTHLLLEECQKRGVPSSRVDFDTEENFNAVQYSSNIVLLLMDILDNLSISTAQIDEIKYAADKLSATPDQILHYGIRAIDDAANQNPLVLFFDNTQDADPALLNLVEERIVAPLMGSGRCIIVWTGRRPRSWSQFELRRHLLSQELGRFEKKDSIAFFQRNSRNPQAIETLMGPVRRVTQGHPLADAIVLRHLDDLIAHQAPTAPLVDFGKVEGELWEKLADELVANYIFRNVQSTLIPICHTISLVRQFDLVLLRKLLEDTNQVPGMTVQEYGGLLNQLVATGLVFWSKQHKAYILDDTLRHILSEYIYRHNSQTYARINTLVAEHYRESISRAGENLGAYIVEELYHRSCVQRICLDNMLAAKQYHVQCIDPENLLCDRLQAYREKQPDEEIQAATFDRLRHELAEDQELHELLGKELHQRLVNRAC